MIGLDIKIQISNRKTELYFSILNFAVSKAIWNTFCIILMVYKVLGFSQDFRTCLCIVLVIRHISIHWPLKLEKVMAPHSSTLACKIPWMEEPRAAVHGVVKSQTWLRNFTFTFHFHALEKEMATHSSVLAWRIPATGEPGALLSMGSHRVGHDWSDLAAAAAAAAWMCYSHMSTI